MAPVTRSLSPGGPRCESVAASGVTSPGCCPRGSRTVTVVPAPGSLSTVMRAAVRLHGAVGDAEAEAGAAADRLGGEEGLEEPRQVRRLDAGAVVADAHLDTARSVRRGVRPARVTEIVEPRLRPPVQRVEGVGQQVHPHLVRAARRWRRSAAPGRSAWSPSRRRWRRGRRAGAGCCRCRRRCRSATRSPLSARANSRRSSTIFLMRSEPSAQMRSSSGVSRSTSSSAGTGAHLLDRRARRRVGDRHALVGVQHLDQARRRSPGGCRARRRRSSPGC